ncbi:MAG: GntR family transcriptional regulator [Lachnospiraceae bacterium]|jgi:DNA-binding transcriptional regulator YhcF (GntR family)|nr:GntR family transcriptional regulator [Lachnospiraceae bacterium]
MYIHIDFNSDEAIYMQLYHQIIMGIALQEMKPGDSLPSVRQLAELTGINMHTVNKAYSFLRQDGFLTIDRRRGAVISIEVDKNASLKKLKKSLQPILAKGYCKNITKEDVYRIVDELYGYYDGEIEED